MTERTPSTRAGQPEHELLLRGELENGLSNLAVVETPLGDAMLVNSIDDLLQALDDHRAEARADALREVGELRKWLLTIYDEAEGRGDIRSLCRAALSQPPAPDPT